MVSDYLCGGKDKKKRRGYSDGFSGLTSIVVPAKHIQISHIKNRRYEM
jgi:hypothetical protein